VTATTHFLASFDAAPLLARLGAMPHRVTSDSRRVGAGVAFAAYPGSRLDGRTFIPDALSRGAAAVLWEPQGYHWNPAHVVANLPVAELQAKLGHVAACIYGRPSETLWTVGVTGTNGKTSCSHWIAHALDGAGRRAAVLGTLGNGLVGGMLEPAANTTSDAALLQETLADLRQRGAQAVVMEVSSIGLDQGRVNGTRFDVALFTNLTRDHLDYHGTMSAYGAAKARLFAMPGLATAVVNADDPFGQSLLETARAHGVRTLTYGAANADVAATSVVMTPAGMALEVATPWGPGEAHARVVGAFNVQNVLGTLGVLLASDVPLDAALAALAAVAPPAGRMERHGGDGKPLVVVDYAHTADALEKVLQALRPAVAEGGGALVCVFGCGGGRDAGKRPEMGRIAGTLADRVVVTSDNPRNEDPAAIASAVAHGLRATGNRHWLIELDRAKAIREAVAGADVGDVVLVAGKGHEPYQEAGGMRSPFSDSQQATAALASWRPR
jgi:UDP-N-acetylmuramoyl-L-alanyl-D-glutamate--2,6-diaminopimelate ligase